MELIVIVVWSLKNTLFVLHTTKCLLVLLLDTGFNFIEAFPVE